VPPLPRCWRRGSDECPFALTNRSRHERTLHRSRYQDSVRRSRRPARDILTPRNDLTRAIFRFLREHSLRDSGGPGPPVPNRNHTQPASQRPTSVDTSKPANDRRLQSGQWRAAERGSSFSMPALCRLYAGDACARTSVAIFVRHVRGHLWSFDHGRDVQLPRVPRCGPSGRQRPYSAADRGHTVRRRRATTAGRNGSTTPAATRTSPRRSSCFDIATESRARAHVHGGAAASRAVPRSACWSCIHGLRATGCKK
jgi:hypothetical protein